MARVGRAETDCRQMAADARAARRFRRTGRLPETKLRLGGPTPNSRCRYPCGYM